MFDNFNPTKPQAVAIGRGARMLAECIGDGYRIEKAINDERRGYGSRSDSVPLTAARGMICVWFLRGFDKPGALLRDCYYCRPASIYAEGRGADIAANAHLRPVNFENIIAAIRDAATSYEAAFKAMHEADKAALHAAFPKVYGAPKAEG